MAARDEQITDRQGTSLGFLTRLWWMLLGNGVLVLSFLLLFRQKGGFFHPADWVFWLTVASLALARYVDIHFCDGQTATGRCASRADWIRYVALLAAGALILWGIAHATNYLLAGRIAGN